MNVLYGLSTLVALALAIYLTVALLKPEWFE
jgi:K+-transporting ATPase KdpF subunit